MVNAELRKRGLGARAPFYRPRASQSVISGSLFPSFPRRREGRVRPLCLEERWFCVGGFGFPPAGSVIPAKAGIHPLLTLRRDNRSTARAPVLALKSVGPGLWASWIPVFTGMTDWGQAAPCRGSPGASGPGMDSRLRGNDEGEAGGEDGGARAVSRLPKRIGAGDGFPPARE